MSCDLLHDCFLGWDRREIPESNLIPCLQIHDPSYISGLFLSDSKYGGGELSRAAFCNARRFPFGEPLSQLSYPVIWNASVFIPKVVFAALDERYGMVESWS